MIAQIAVLAGFFDSWTKVQLASSSYQDIAYGNGVFVAVGRDSIAASEDGFTWREFPAPENDHPRGVTFGNGRFVMVSEAVGSPSVNQRVFTSTDGENWSAIDIGSHELVAVAYANNIFIAAGRRLVTVHPGWESRSSFFRSQNGLDWEYQHVDLPGGINAVAFDNGIFVAVGWRNNDFGVIYRSTDGSNWEPSEWTLPPTLKAVAGGNGLFVTGGLTANVFTSRDGREWSEQPCATPGYYDMAAFLNGTFFVGRMHSSDFAVSADGVNWRAHNLGPDESSIRDFVFAEGRFVGVTYLGKVVLSQDITTPVLSLNTDTNGVRIEVAAELGKSSSLSRSANLVEWLPFTSLTNTSTLFEVDHPAEGTASFFKLQNQTVK